MRGILSSPSDDASAADIGMGPWTHEERCREPYRVECHRARRAGVLDGGERTPHADAPSTSRSRSTGSRSRSNRVPDSHGTRLQRVLSPVGRLVASYDASIEGEAAGTVANATDLITYRRPSRYAESDALGPTAFAEFGQHHRSRRAARLGLLLGRHAPLVRERVEPADRRRDPHPARPAGRVPRLRAPHASRCCAHSNVPARLVVGLRARAVPDGLPRGRRGVGRRRVARRRRDHARAAVDARAHRDGAGCRRLGVPDDDLGPGRPGRHGGHRRSSTSCRTTTSTSSSACTEPASRAALWRASRARGNVAGMKKWVVRFLSLLVFDVVVLLVIGWLTPARVGWSALWAGVILTALTIWIKPLIHGMFQSMAAEVGGPAHQGRREARAGRPGVPRRPHRLGRHRACSPASASAAGSGATSCRRSSS